jgi:hypothetical protein
VRITAPAGMDQLAVVDTVSEAGALVKAKRDRAIKGLDRTFRREKPMAQLSKRTVAAYDKIIDKMFKELMKFIGTKIVPGVKLSKGEDDEGMYGFVADIDWPDAEMVAFASGEDPSESPFSPRRFLAEKKLSLLTPGQFETVKQIVRDYHSAFAVGMFGPDAIPAEEVQRLIDAGILPQDLALIFQPAPGELPPPAERVTDLAYQYGAMLAKPAQKDAARKMTADQFVTHLERTRPQLNAVERQAMAFARFNAGEHIRGMGDRFALEVGTLIRNADAEQRRRYLGTVQRELERNIDRRGTWRELASEIGHATKDWSRDMQRVAATEKQSAMQEGTAREMAKGRDPAQIRVAKIPAPDACSDCIRLHLTAGQGSAPRIFKLSELQSNGTNVGRKRANWKAGVGPVHPWCGCELQEVPPGFAFDAEGTMLPESMIQKGDRIDRTFALLKSEEAQKPHMTHRDAVPEDMLVIRIGDPVIRQVVEAVVAEAPPEIFHRNVGVTLITTDTPRAQNPLEEHDFAYWSANEIRLHQTLPVERIPRVLRHELGHSLNVYLIRTLGSVEAVRAWHDELWDISAEEGYVSSYAMKLPIENAAEATRFYLFERPKLMLNFPSTFSFLHRHYREIFES